MANRLAMFLEYARMKHAQEDPDREFRPDDAELVHRLAVDTMKLMDSLRAALDADDTDAALDVARKLVGKETK